MTEGNKLSNNTQYFYNSDIFTDFVNISVEFMPIFTAFRQKYDQISVIFKTPWAARPYFEIVSRRGRGFVILPGPGKTSPVNLLQSWTYTACHTLYIHCMSYAEIHTVHTVIHRNRGQNPGFIGFLQLFPHPGRLCIIFIHRL